MKAILNVDVMMTDLANGEFLMFAGDKVDVEIVYQNVAGIDMAVISNEYCLGMVIEFEHLSQEFLH